MTARGLAETSSCRLLTARGLFRGMPEHYQSGIEVPSPPVLGREEILTKTPPEHTTTVQRG